MSLVKSSIRDAIPAEIHGFAVDIRVGPYPIGAPTRQRAVYAVLTPSDPAVARRMRASGQAQIMACVPLTPEAAAAIDVGDDDLKEQVALGALSQAARLAKRVWESR